MTDHPSLDEALASLSGQGFAPAPEDFMDGVWQRAGQLGEIAERRRRTALFAGLFIIGLGAGVGTTGIPYGYGAPQHGAVYDFAASEQLSPAALLHVGR
jgi:hypothetical protein